MLSPPASGVTVSKMAWSSPRTETPITGAAIAGVHCCVSFAVPTQVRKFRGEKTAANRVASDKIR